MNASLADFPNLGEKSAFMLQAAGITDASELRELGPVIAFLAVCQAGQRPSLNLLWAIAAGLQNRHWTELSAAEKDELRSELADLTR